MSNTVVNTNVMALNSHRSLRSVGTLQSKASARLSSGVKVNSGADDAAGLAISEKMRAQIRGLDMAGKNSQDAMSMLQIADGGMSEIDNMVQRIRELTVQAANETNQKEDDPNLTTPENADTSKLAAEASQLLIEVSAMAQRTEFNKIKLLQDSNITDSEKSLVMQVGANAGQTMQIDILQITKASLSLDSTVDNISIGGTAASKEISQIDEALNVINKERARLGAYQNRLEYTVKSLDIASENTSASESRIRDADMAKEMMNVSKANVLQQAATSMLSQANQAPQNILQLLR